MDEIVNIMEVGKHIIIKSDEIVNGHIIFKVINKHYRGDIALIEYYPTWKKYVLSPYNDIVFDISCLEEIIIFMKSIKFKELSK